MFAIFPEILQASKARDLETLACLIRKYFGGGQIYAPRLQVEPILEAMGIRVQREQAPFHARLQVLDHRGQYHVAITLHCDIEDRREINYSLAHLLGYFLLGMQALMAQGELSAEAYQLDQATLPRLSQLLAIKGKKVKQETRQLADAFAAALLLPKGMVKKAHQTLPQIIDSAAFFHVSPLLVEHRLRSLGLIEATDKSPSVAEKGVAQPSTTRAAASEAAKGIRQQTKSQLPASPASPASPARKSDHSSSLTRVQQSVASLSYKREDSRTAPDTAEPRDNGLKRLRQLAKKIDQSVDP